ncbi:MAG: hypothetical protein SGPRY_004359, partial [Prymnesium sp.]
MPVAWQVGDRVTYQGIPAIVRYVGMTLWSSDPHEYVGIEFFMPVGKHDGVVGETRYFSAYRNSALFVRGRFLLRAHASSSDPLDEGRVGILGRQSCAAEGLDSRRHKDTCVQAPASQTHRRLASPLHFGGECSDRPGRRLSCPASGSVNDKSSRRQLMRADGEQGLAWPPSSPTAADRKRSLPRRVSGIGIVEVEPSTVSLHCCVPTVTIDLEELRGSQKTRGQEKSTGRGHRPTGEEIAWREKGQKLEEGVYGGATACTDEKQIRREEARSGEESPERVETARKVETLGKEGTLNWEQATGQEERRRAEEMRGQRG